MIKQQLYNLIRVMVFFCAILFSSLLIAQVGNDSVVVNSKSKISNTPTMGELHIVGNVIISGMENIKNVVVSKSQPLVLDQKISNTISHKSVAKQLDVPKPTIKVKVHKLGLNQVKVSSGSSDGKWQNSNHSISKSSVLSVVQFKFLTTFIFCFIFCFIFRDTNVVNIRRRFFNIISLFLKVGFGRPPPVSL